MGDSPTNSPAPASAALPSREASPMPGPALASIEIDDAASLDETASHIDDRISTYTASLTSSVLDYPMEYGRRYHAFRDGAYLAPNDESEMKRLDFNHMVVMKAIGNKLYLAPVQPERTHRILDIGTGTGVWAIDVADLFPNAEILGNDLSAIQPAWVPPNVRFEIDDVESPWLYEQKFNFIFSRYMACSISDWPKLVQRIYDNLEPGGWVEFQDYDLLITSEDGSMKDDHQTYKWDQLLLRACNKVHREPCPGPKIEDWVKNAGFINVTHKEFKLPFGPWPKDPHYKDLGMANLIQFLEGLEAFSMRAFCDVLGWKGEEVQVLLAIVRKEMKENAFHAHNKIHVVYAQKP